MMLLAAALAQQGAEEAADVAHDAGWILEHAWIFPLIPFVSFLLILGFGKQLKYKGAELGIAALAACFVLSLGAGVQWIRYVDDVNAAESHGEASAAVVATTPQASPVGAPGESAGAAAQSSTEGRRRAPSPTITAPRRPRPPGRPPRSTASRPRASRTSSSRRSRRRGPGGSRAAWTSTSASSSTACP